VVALPSITQVEGLQVAVGWTTIARVMSDQERVALAAEAFIYGYPLVADLEQVVRYTTEGAGVLPAALFNRFGHGARLAGPDDTYVSINNDTVNCGEASSRCLRRR
jgi:hypothetical protein